MGLALGPLMGAGWDWQQVCRGRERRAEPWSGEGQPECRCVDSVRGRLQGSDEVVNMCIFSLWPSFTHVRASSRLGPNGTLNSPATPSSHTGGSFLTLTCTFPHV